jgi:hypothetical protein
MSATWESVYSRAKADHRADQDGEQGDQTFGTASVRHRQITGSRKVRAKEHFLIVALVKRIQIWLTNFLIKLYH